MLNSLGDEPKLHQLKHLKVGGEKLQIIQKVAVLWEDLALLLEFDYGVIKIIREDTKHDTCVKSCEEMLYRWLEGEACQPVTWGRLIQAIRDVELDTFARRIEKLLKP